MQGAPAADTTDVDVGLGSSPPKSPSGTKLIEFKRFKIDHDDVLGNGGSGIVFRAELKSRQIAIKRFHPDSEDAFEAELKALRHPKIVGIFGGTQCPTKEVYYLAMELMHCSFAKALKLSGENKNKIDWTRRRQHLQDIAEAMEFIHGQPIPTIHRDLRTENVLLSGVLDGENTVAKVSDFGISVSLEHTNMKAVNGTPIRWRAPELLSDTSVVRKSSDVYSFGMVMYHALTHKEPFHGIKGEEEIKELLTNQARPCTKVEKDAMRGDCPHKLKSLMEDCWKQTPDERPTFSKIRNALERVPLEKVDVQWALEDVKELHHKIHEAADAETATEHLRKLFVLAEVSDALAMSTLPDFSCQSQNRRQYSGECVAPGSCFRMRKWERSEPLLRRSRRCWEGIILVWIGLQVMTFVRWSKTVTPSPTMNGT